MIGVRGLTLWLATLALGGMVACDGGQPPEDAQLTGQTADQTTPTGAQAGAAAQAKYGEVIDKVVRWPALSELDGEARLGMTPQALAAIDEAPVPVFAVSQSTLLASAIVTRGKVFAALSAHGEGVTVSLHGTSRAQRYAHVKPAVGPARVRDKAAFITRNEGIWSAAWIEGGVAYSLEVECDVLPDPRCEDDSYLMQLAAALVFVGGREVKP